MLGLVARSVAQLAAGMPDKEDDVEMQRSAGDGGCLQALMSRSDERAIELVSRGMRTGAALSARCDEKERMDEGLLGDAGKVEARALHADRARRRVASEREPGDAQTSDASRLCDLSSGIMRARIATLTAQCPVVHVWGGFHVLDEHRLT
jgi:hypothetical protein